MLFIKQIVFSQLYYFKKYNNKCMPKKAKYFFGHTFINKTKINELYIMQNTLNHYLFY